MIAYLKYAAILLLSLHITVFGKDNVPPLHVDAKQLQCLTDVIYNEAAGESSRGKIAVGQVVLNRVNHGFASTPCKVVHQTSRIGTRKVCQFAIACNPKKSIPFNDAYRESKQIATELLSGVKKEVVDKNTLFFHSVKVNPRWKLRRTIKIGNHYFYEKR